MRKFVFVAVVSALMLSCGKQPGPEKEPAPFEQAAPEVATREEAAPAVIAPVERAAEAAAEVKEKPPRVPQETPPKPKEIELAREELQNLLAKMQLLHENATSFSADFTNRKESSIVSDERICTGRLWVQKPDRLRREVHQPSRTTLIVNGTKVWVYFPDERKGERFDLGKRKGAGASEANDLLGGLSFDLAKIEEKYEVRAVRMEPPDAAAAPYRLELKSRQESETALIALWIDGERPWPSSWLIENAAGDISRDDFFNVKLDPKLDESLFQEPSDAKEWTSPTE